MPSSPKTRKKRSLSAEIDRLSAQIEALMKLREVLDTRFSAVSEKIGEIRSMVLTQERENAELRKRIEKTISVVEETKPESLYAEFKKKEAEMEMLRDRLSSTEEILQTIVRDLKDLRRTVVQFKGIQGLMKLSKEVRGELRTVQKTKGEIEKHADKITSIFIEVQRRFKDFAKLSVKVDSHGETIKSLNKTVSAMEVKLNEFVTKAELGKTVEDLEKLNKTVESLRSQVAAFGKEVEDLSKAVKSAGLRSVGESQTAETARLDELEVRIKKLERVLDALSKRSGKRGPLVPAKKRGMDIKIGAETDESDELW